MMALTLLGKKLSEGQVHFVGVGFELIGVACLCHLSYKNNLIHEVRKSSPQHYALGVKAAGRLFAGRLAPRRKYVPEAQSLVSCPRDDGAAIGAHGEVEHAVCVAGQCGYLFHARVLPHIDLVVRIAVGAYDFVVSLAEHQVAHLRAYVHSLEGLASEGVPEPDSPVCRASAGHQKAVLVRGPRDCLHCGEVVCEFEDWLAGMVVPDEEFVVVASGAKLLLIEGPLQPADFLLVTGQLIDEGHVGTQVAL